MSFSEFEKEMSLQNQVMAITQVHKEDYEPTHLFGCIYKNLHRVFDGRTMVLSIGSCSCEGFENNCGFKDETPQIPGGFGLFLSKGSDQRWTPDGERFKCGPEMAYAMFNCLPKDVMKSDERGRFDALKFEPYREGLKCDVVVCFCNADQMSAAIMLHGYDKPEHDRVVATTASGCASMTRIPFAEMNREKPRAVITGNDIAQRKLMDENKLAIAFTGPEFEKMMTYTGECFFHSPVWKAVRKRLRKDEDFSEVRFSTLGTGI